MKIEKNVLYVDNLIIPCDVLDVLNNNLNNKGIMIKRTIITSVILDSEISDNMQEATIYQFKSTLERKRFAFNQRITNDKEELEKEK